MNTSETTYQKALRTISTHILSGDCIKTDAPTDNQGKGEAFSPTDLLATSLTCCMLTIMGIASKEHGFSIDGTKATTVKLMDNDPRRVCEIRIELKFPSFKYTDAHKRIISHISKTCPVALSLHTDIRQNVTLLFD